jgi:hypothetical protein
LRRSSDFLPGLRKPAPDRSVPSSLVLSPVDSDCPGGLCNLGNRRSLLRNRYAPEPWLCWNQRSVRFSTRYGRCTCRLRNNHVYHPCIRIVSTPCPASLVENPYEAFIDIWAARRIFRIRVIPDADFCRAINCDNPRRPRPGCVLILRAVPPKQRAAFFTKRPSSKTDVEQNQASLSGLPNAPAETRG